MKYMLLIFSNPENWAALSEAETKEVMDEYWQFTQTITELRRVRLAASRCRAPTPARSYG